MNRGVLTVVAVVLVLLGVVAMSSLFIVDQTEQALVLQLGEPRGPVRGPGLHLKRPFIENVITYDKRVLGLEPPPEEVIASDQKRLVVDSYAVYRIVDPLMFYQSVGVESAARSRLDSIVSASLRRVLGNVTLSAVLSPQRGEIMRHIRDEVNTEAKSFGIDVIDVRLRRADLPQENSQAIYARMQSEREREASQFRAQGAEASARIRAIAERDRTVMLAEAERDGQKLRGEGDAESIGVYAAAFDEDKSFFAFYRSMQAYRRAFEGGETSFVLSPQGDFFRYFQSWVPASPTGGAPPPSPTGPAAPAVTAPPASQPLIPPTGPLPR